MTILQWVTAMWYELRPVWMFGIMCWVTLFMLECRKLWQHRKIRMPKSEIISPNNFLKEQKWQEIPRYFK